ncbi:hypothetical protein ENTCAN_06362 [Enterobacter cancerogenus ATCC 35316]|nr:hypothetical protein ENTCAN_06362 [Enterobacter cancerogenus ATCC 35316]
MVIIGYAFKQLTPIARQWACKHGKLFIVAFCLLWLPVKAAEFFRTVIVGQRWGGKYLVNM